MPYCSFRVVILNKAGRPSTNPMQNYICVSVTRSSSLQVQHHVRTEMVAEPRVRQCCADRELSVLSSLVLKLALVVPVLLERHFFAEPNHHQPSLPAIP
jgi:hypothetical protein